MNEPEKTMGKDVADNGGEYSYKKVGDQVTDAHRTEPTKTIMNKCKCGKPWTHEIWTKGAFARLCCSCYVQAGNPPADWHDDCLISYKKLLEEKMPPEPGKKTEPECITLDDQVESIKVMVEDVAKNGGEYSFKSVEGQITDVHKRVDPNQKIIVLNITTGFGKVFTCRTAEQLGQFIDNYKAEKKLKRDEDVNIQIGYGRMNQAEYDQVPECKYFDK